MFKTYLLNHSEVDLYEIISANKMFNEKLWYTMYLSEEKSYKLKNKGISSN